MENRLLYLTGDIVVEGLPVDEVGVEDENIKDERPVMAAPVTMPQKTNKEKKKTISSTIEHYSQAKDNETSELKKINDNLAIIIEQNNKKLWLMEKKN